MVTSLGSKPHARREIVICLVDSFKIFASYLCVIACRSTTENNIDVGEGEEKEDDEEGIDFCNSIHCFIAPK
jgi:hypothetical protein